MPIERLFAARIAQIAANPNRRMLRLIGIEAAKLLAEHDQNPAIRATASAVAKVPPKSAQRLPSMVTATVSQKSAHMASTTGWLNRPSVPRPRSIT